MCEDSDLFGGDVAAKRRLQAIQVTLIGDDHEHAPDLQRHAGAEGCQSAGPVFPGCNLPGCPGNVSRQNRIYEGLTVLIARPRGEIRMLGSTKFLPRRIDVRFFGLGVARRDRGANDVGAHAAITRREGFDERRHCRGVHRVGRNDAVDIAKRTRVVGIASSRQQDGVYQTAVEPDTHPYSGLGCL